ERSAAGARFAKVEAAAVIRNPDVDPGVAVAARDAEASYIDAVIDATGVLASVDAGLDDGVRHLIDLVRRHAELPGEVAGRTGGRDLDVRDHRERQLHLPLGGCGHGAHLLRRLVKRTGKRRAVLIQAGMPP